MISREQLLTELRGNSRLRIGLYIVLGIVWFYVLLVLRDATAGKSRQWQELRAQESRARASASSADWKSRAQIAVAGVADIETLLWRDGSVGLSQAAFQEKITQLAGRQGASLRSIRSVAPRSPSAELEALGIAAIGVRVQIESRPSSFMAWAGELSKFSGQPAILADTLTLRMQPGQPFTIESDLSGYAIRNPAPADGREARDIPAAAPSTPAINPNK